MKTSADTRNIGMILKGVRDKSLIPKAHFQRRAVWTSRDKIELIRTIMDGYPFPEIYIAAGSVNTESGETTELLVDGQQRVRTIDEYFKGEKPFNTNRVISTYSNLTDEDKKKFLSYDVAIRNMGLIDDSEIREAFRRMNSTSYNLNDMERYNAVFLGEFKKFCEKVASAGAFRKWRVFSPNDIRRMKDVSYVASLVATMMSNYFNRDEEVENYLENYDEEFKQSENIAWRLSKVIEYIEMLDLPRDLRAWGKADFFNLFIEVDRQLYRYRKIPNVTKLAPVLTKFYRDVTASREKASDDVHVQSYFEATLQGVNDRGARVARGNALKAVIESVESKPFEIPESVDFDIKEILNIDPEDVENIEDQGELDWRPE
jgi:hypothetical protein